jgi:hypothetical protein
VSFILCGVFAFVGVLIALILLLGKTRLKPMAQASSEFPNSLIKSD